ncbi:hypothetical protein GCM10007147_03730 [Nocardiopsis kunsanensis]|uniref:Uncharacterized protein n=1 Tax=Nocardiopsis kunsanensis TaxID=141693 RepID=A0A918X7S3_9ACTN|nr:hypothetical protein GCM10007147_03730 [Nocardiopsis kunsanensis]
MTIRAFWITDVLRAFLIWHVQYTARARSSPQTEFEWVFHTAGMGGELPPASAQTTNAPAPSACGSRSGVPSDIHLRSALISATSVVGFSACYQKMTAFAFSSKIS